MARPLRSATKMSQTWGNGQIRRPVENLTVYQKRNREGHPIHVFGSVRSPHPRQAQKRGGG